eukprot:2643557-Amphidinium_carterae.1
MAAAPAVEYVSPAPAQYMAAAPAVEYVAPAPAQYMAAAPAVEYVAPAPAQYMAAAPVVAPATTYVAPAPAQYVAPAPVVEYVAPAPAITMVAPPVIAMAPPIVAMAPPTMPTTVQQIPSAFVPAGPPTMGARAAALPPKPPVFLPGKAYDIGVSTPVKTGPGVTTAQEKLVGGPPVAPVSTTISARSCQLQNASTILSVHALSNATTCGKLLLCYIVNENPFLHSSSPLLCNLHEFSCSASMRTLVFASFRTSMCNFCLQWLVIPSLL